MNSPIIKERVQSACKLSGISQKHLCELLNKDRAFLSNVFRGYCAITDDQVQTIADALHTTSAYLTGETDDPAPTGSPDELSSEEKELLELYRSVSTEKQELFRNIIEQLKG